MGKQRGVKLDSFSCSWGKWIMLVVLLSEAVLALLAGTSADIYARSFCILIQLPTSILTLGCMRVSVMQQLVRSAAPW